MALPVALQLYTVRDFLAEDFNGTLAKVKEMGYEGVELSGLNGADPVKVKEMLDANDLKVMSSHVPLAEMLPNPEEAADRYLAAGCKYMAIPWTGEETRTSPEVWDEHIAKFAELGKRLKAKGIQLLYHNHDFEFRKFGDETLLDILYSKVDPEYLQTQLDTCWVKFSGNDPVAYLSKYAGRAPLVHLKDFHLEGASDVAPYELIGKVTENKGGGSSFEFRPVGHGDQDMPSILEASEKAGASWVIVEQDRSVGRTSLEAAAMSRAYLKGLGW